LEQLPRLQDADLARSLTGRLLETRTHSSLPHIAPTTTILLEQVVSQQQQHRIGKDDIHRNSVGAIRTVLEQSPDAEPSASLCKVRRRLQELLESTTTEDRMGAHISSWSQPRLPLLRHRLAQRSDVISTRCYLGFEGGCRAVFIASAKTTTIRFLVVTRILFIGGANWPFPFS
jgi:hypothetical protein